MSAEQDILNCAKNGYGEDKLKVIHKKGFLYYFGTLLGWLMLFFGLLPPVIGYIYFDIIFFEPFTFFMGTFMGLIMLIGGRNCLKETEFID